MPRRGNASPERADLVLLHYCRMQRPRFDVSTDAFASHLTRARDLFNRKEGIGKDPNRFVQDLHAIDWYLAIACIEGCAAAWEHLFASRAGRTDCFLVDALRARSQRLYPGDEERQDSAVTEFWSQLLVSENQVSPPVLMRYDGQRPLIPWLIRVFQNWHISMLRQRKNLEPLPDDQVSEAPPTHSSTRWHEAFCIAAREIVENFTEQEQLIVGLRFRYRLSQRDVAAILGVHEGTISRQTTQLRDRVLNHVESQLLQLGWAGDDLSHYILRELGGVLLDDPRLSASNLQAVLRARGKHLPTGKEE